MANASVSSPSPHTQSLTYDELLRVLKAAKANERHGMRNWAMLLTTFAHALRASEVCKLRIGNLTDGHLDLKRLKGSLRTIQPLQPHKGVPLLDEVKAMKQWLAERPTNAGDALFPSQKGGRMTSTQLYRIFRHAAADAGLPEQKQHPHVLKHTCATMLVRSDMNVAEVKVYLGHKAISSTMRYVQVTDSEASAEAARRFMRMREDASHAASFQEVR